MRPVPEEAADVQRLDQVVTQWSLLRVAHQPVSLDGPQARQELLLRYRGAIRSNVCALLLNETDAEDVAQDVLIRLMRGDFATADPSRGRFRDFLKVAVKNMVRNHWDRQHRRSAVSFEANPVLEPATDSASSDAAWTNQWRGQLLEGTWRALEQFERDTPSCIYYTVLRLRSEHPDEDSARVAERMSELTGKTWRPDAYRQQLRRARLRFAQLLVEELSHSLKQPTPDAVEEELVDLGLIDFVRPFLPEDWRERGELRESV
ncbi:MAG: sigma-70 family polymerase sigma factor [Planctomycetaceae bacterium]|nr:sigma-70 family polymerase sigma factor [Planctomycetaceae bacterium]